MNKLDFLDQKLNNQKPFCYCRWMLNAAPPARLTTGMTDQAGSHYDLVNEFYDVIYVIKGTGIYIDEFGNKTQYTDGAVYQRIPGKLHSTATKPAPQILQLYFSMPPYCWKNFVEKGIIDNTQRLFHPGINNHLVDLFFTINNYLKTPSEYSLQLSLNTMEQFLIETKKLDQLQHNPPSFKTLEKGAELLADHLYNELSIQEISKKIGLGYEAFRKQFKQQYGLSPHAFRIKRRIEQAASWLKMSNLTLEEIAERLGYPDPFTLSKQFKKQTGQSPQHFRSNEQ